jgi:hypothetical protein
MATSVKMAVFWDVAPCSLVEIDRSFRGTYCPELMMGALSSSETSMNFYQTVLRNIPEDGHLQQGSRTGEQTVSETKQLYKD